MKIIVTTISTDLVANSLLSSFFSFLINEKQESSFQQVGGLVTKYILLQRHAEFNKIL